MLRYIIIFLLLIVTPSFSAIDFSGDADDVLTIGDLDHLDGDLSCSAWVNVDELSVDQRAIIYAFDSSGATNDDEFAFRIETSTAGQLTLFTFSPTSGTTRSDTGNLVPLDIWTHVGFRYTDATPTCELFINGIEVSGYSSSTCENIQTTSLVDWTIGRGEASGNDEMNGEIALPACWTSALSDHEFLQLYEGGFPTSNRVLEIDYDSLLFFMPLNEDKVGNAADTTSNFYKDIANDNDGTITDADGDTLNTSEQSTLR